MKLRTYGAVPAALLLPALIVCSLCLAAPAGAAISPSAYGVGALCSTPPAGYAGCLGLRLVAKRPLAVRGAQASTPAVGPALERIEFTSPWAGSFSPQNLLTGYGLSEIPSPAPRQTLALVDAFNDPTAAHDLKVFDEHFGLPPCTTTNGCFRKVEMKGGSPETGPPTNAGWAQEIATDVEVAHGVCPSCAIVLVEAHSASFPDLEAAEEEAQRLGAGEISNSWGGAEPASATEEEAKEAEAEDNAGPFNHPGTVITASSGDNGYLGWAAKEGAVEYPASSPHVVAVGGTRLELGAGGAWAGETVWNGKGAGGGGCSTLFQAPPWQQSVTGWSAVGCGKNRAVADVSADADPYTGVAVYDSTPIVEKGKEYLGWWTMGGTSVASPIVAGTFALAGGAGKTVSYPAQTLYESLPTKPGSLHDVVEGSNGACGKPFNAVTGLSGCELAEEEASCSPKLICIATTGYDGPTGVGTPDGIAAFQPPGAKASPETVTPTPSENPTTNETTKETPTENQSTNSTSQTSTSASSATVVPTLSALSLTRTAVAALNHHRPKVSQVRFTFTISATAHVRVTLARRVRVHGHWRWQPLPNSLTIAAARGRNGHALGGRNTLAPGRYELTLTPVHGVARTVTFNIH
jgi:hypothetical protein